MASKKGIIKYILIFISSLIGCSVLIYFKIIDLSKIILLEEGFHYNAISLSAIIGGFLFTGISILISAIDKERIKRLWEHNYLDNLYRSAVTGVVFNIVTIISAFALLITSTDEDIVKYFIYIESCSMIIGLIFFAWCIKQLMKMISRLKDNN